MTLSPEPAETGAQPYVSKIDRRVALAWISAAAMTAAAGTGAALAVKGHKSSPASQALGYGIDPNLIHPTTPWPRLMTPLQLQTTALLCDYILPASGRHPSASAVGVPDFIDEWVSAPYPDQVADRATIVSGLDLLEQRSRQTRHAPVSALNAAQREELFRTLIQKPLINLTGPAKAVASVIKGPLHETLFGDSVFLRRFRHLTVGAYYTTDAGFADIGYVGNVALTQYPPLSSEVKALLDARLKSLKL